MRKAFDVEATVGAIRQDPGLYAAVRNVEAVIVFADPGVDMFDVEGDSFAEIRDFLLKSDNGGLKKQMLKRGIEGVELMVEPETRRKRFVGIEAIGSERIDDEKEAEFDDEERMFEQERSKLCGVGETFANA